ncbi:tenascin-X isoform X2 [Phyllostomus discolor]|uniref:Tenascin-X isoform X2 n=1 Tax=Phyllostomus discolor TaxID=89673 RepID=A0A7E6DL73_9CHIR|nr:tenascin-X isoform X2 [Phyllostomus discolor]
MEAPATTKQPLLGQLTVTESSLESLRLSWTVPEGQFDHFLVQYRNGDGQPKVVRVPGHEDGVTISGLEPDHKYKMNLYGFHDGQRQGPISAIGVTAAEEETPSPTEPGTEAPEPPEEPLLGELTVTESSPDSLSLSWTVPQGHFDSFTVQYKDRDGRPQVVRVGGEEREVTVQGLEPGRKYKMHLYGLHGGQRVGPVSTVGLTVPEVEQPASPTLKPSLGQLTVTDATVDSLRLSWTIPEGQFDHFLVQYKNGDGQPKVVRVPGHEDGVTISGLEPDHKYKMNLYGFHDGQRQGPISAIGVTAAEEETPSPTEPGTEAPEPPEEPLLGELTVTESSPDSLSLSWTVPQGHFDSFTVQYKDRDGRPQVVRVGGEEREVTVQGLEPGRKYKMHLYGLHGGQRVGPVSTVGLTVPEVEQPASPTLKPSLGQLTVTDATVGSLHLSWTVPEGQFDHFLVQYKNGDGQPKVVRVPGHEDGVTISGLEPDHKYKMNLYGFHDGQRQGPISAIGVTAAEEETPSPTEPGTEAPEPPEEPLLGELTVTESSPDSLSLSWTVPQGHFDSFTVQYKDRDGRPQVVRVGGEEREVTVQGLEPGRKYKMHLYGLHGGQRVGPVSTVGLTAPQPEETPAATNPPLEPRLGVLTVTGVTPTSVGLMWTVAEGQFDSFVIQYKDRDGQLQVIPVAMDQHEATIAGLEPARKYRMHVYGLHGGQRVGPLSAVAVTAAQGDASPGAPPRLGELWVTEPTTDSLHLFWTVPEGHFDSFAVQFKDRDGPRIVPVAGHERSVTITPLDSGRKYRFLLYGLLGKKRHGPLTADGTTETQGAVDDAGTKRPSKPHLGEELQVTSVTPDSVGLAWTVPEGQFDSFVIQYKDKDGQPQVVPVEGSLREVRVSGLDPSRRYKLLLYGLYEGRRVGPITAVTVTAPREEIGAETMAPNLPQSEPQLGELTVDEATPHTLHLSWTVTEGEFDSFEVQYIDEDGKLQVVSLGGNRNDITLSGLESNHRYLVNVYGFHGRHRLGPIQVESLTVPRKEENELPETSIMGPEAPPIKPLLGELTVTDATVDSLRLSWTVPEGKFDHFLVQYKNRDGQPKEVRVPGHEDGVTILGLEPDHKYKMNLYGFHDGQRQGPISAIGVTAAEEETPSPTEPGTEAPEPPEEPLLGELTVTESSPDSLSLSWTVPQGHFDSFTVQYKDRDGRPQVLRVGGEEREVTVQGLEPGRKYKMHLYGLHGGQRVGPVSTVGLTVPEVEQPASPTLKPSLGQLTVTDATVDSLRLSWTIPEGQFDHFLVQYKNGDGQPKAVRVPGHEDGVTISGLEPDHKYKMNLYGFHDGQRQGPISAIGVTAAEEETPSPTEPGTEAPEPPEEPLLGELTVTESSPDSLSLSWTIPQGHFDSFTVQYKDRDGRPQVVRVGGEEREVTVQGLEPGRKYKMHLYGLHGGQRVGPVSTVGLTAHPALDHKAGTTQVPATSTPEPPIKPLLGELTVTDATEDSLRLSWTIPEGQFDHFLVQYKNGDGQPKAVRVPGHEDGVTISGLEPDHKYKMNLYGFHNGQRQGPISAIGVTAAEEETPSPTEPGTEAPEPPEEPLLGELTVTESSPDSLSLSWTIPQGHFDSFTVQYKDRDGRPQVVRVGGEEREVTVQGLEPGRKYKMHLYGLHGGQRVGPVSTVGLTAPEEAPESPEGPRLGVLAVTDRTPDSLRLSWTVAQGSFDSFVVQYWDTDRQSQALLVGGDQNRVLVSGLEPSTPYKFFLYGLREGKRLGPVSAEGTTGSAPAGQSLGEPGPRLSQLSVTDVTTSSLRLNWEAPSGAFDSFLLRYGVPSASTLELHPRPLLQREVTVPGTRRSAVLRDLRPGSLYSLTLYGLRGPHNADSVQGTARTLSPVLESPRDLQFSEIGETSARVSWMPPPSRVDSFKVSYQLAEGGEPQSVQVDSQARTQQLKGLVPGARYEVTVVSVRGFEESEPLTGFLTTVPDGPTKLRALNLTEGTAMLHWKPPQAPVDTYHIRVTAPGTPSLQASAPSSTVDYPLHGLELHTNYTATVRGLRGPNLTSPASITFTTGLEGPRDLEAKEVTPRTALLTWTEPQVPPTSYLLTYDTPGGQTQEIELAGGLTSHQLRGLFPSTSYRAWLRAVWGESLTPPMSTSFTTGGLRVPFPRDCGEEMQNGVGTSRTSTIFLNGNREQPLNVFCDMETDGGGWLVFQRRMDGHTDFWRDWEDYARGFGNISGEFWLGNEVLHSLTRAGDYSMRVDLRAGDEAVFAQYDSFRVDSASEYYRLHLEGYHGTAGDSMSYHSGSVFSARDRDPNNLLISCAVSYRGAWWYRNCHYANLNGLYGSTVDHQGVSWYHWKGFEFSVPFTEMKLRPRGYQAPAWGG